MNVLGSSRGDPTREPLAMRHEAILPRLCHLLPDCWICRGGLSKSPWSMSGDDRGPRTPATSKGAACDFMGTLHTRVPAQGSPVSSCVGELVKAVAVWASLAHFAR